MPQASSWENLTYLFGLWSLGRSKLLLVFGFGSGLFLASSLDIQYFAFVIQFVFHD